MRRSPRPHSNCSSARQGPLLTSPRAEPCSVTLCHGLARHPHDDSTERDLDAPDRRRRGLSGRRIRRSPARTTPPPAVRGFPAWPSDANANSSGGCRSCRGAPFPPSPPRASGSRGRSALAPQRPHRPGPVPRWVTTSRYLTRKSDRLMRSKRQRSGSSACRHALLAPSRGRLKHLHDKWNHTRSG